MLYDKFGRGGYRVEMRDGSYAVYAGQRLTAVRKTIHVTFGIYDTDLLSHRAI